MECDNVSLSSPRNRSAGIGTFGFVKNAAGLSRLRRAGPSASLDKSATRGV